MFPKGKKNFSSSQKGNSDESYRPGEEKETKIMENERIRRPPNAFMIFARDHRRRKASENPHLTNKFISTILGSMWKELDPDAKKQYYNRAKQVEFQHKQRYPDYRYNPQQARQMKELRIRKRYSHRNSTDKERKPTLQKSNSFKIDEKWSSLNEICLAQAVANINEKLRKEAIHTQVFMSMGLAETIYDEEASNECSKDQ